MVKHHNKERVNLTIDAQVWAECLEARQLLNINWSEVAEQAFIVVLAQTRKVLEVVASVPEADPEVRLQKLKESLSAYAFKEFGRTYEDIEALSLIKSETLSESE